MVMIAEFTGRDRTVLLPLLLLGDEDLTQVRSYMQTGRVLVAQVANRPVGALLLTAIDDVTVEVKNLAVTPDMQRRVIGSQLVAAAKKRCVPGQRMIVGTGDADLQNIHFYLQNGFRFYGVRKGFFKRYAAPIFANGVQLVDMVMLEQFI